jgi:hypothetical protein
VQRILAEVARLHEQQLGRLKNAHLLPRITHPIGLSVSRRGAHSKLHEERNCHETADCCGRLHRDIN